MFIGDQANVKKNYRERKLVFLVQRTIFIFEKYISLQIYRHNQYVAQPEIQSLVFILYLHVHAIFAWFFLIFLCMVEKISHSV